jgi:hypothetical protein
LQAAPRQAVFAQIAGIAIELEHAEANHSLGFLRFWH